VTLSSIFKARLLLGTMCLVALWPRLSAASVSIEIDGVDSEIKRNVQAFLSLERYAKSDDLDAATVERIAERVPREVRAALKPFGYYEPAVESRVEAVAGSRTDWRAKIKIDVGKPVLIEAIEIKVVGPGADDRIFREIKARAGIRHGQRLNHATYERVKGDLQRGAASYGYLDAALTRNELLVDPPNFKASAHIELATGKRYRFGATDIKQEVIDESLMRRYLRYHEGGDFDATALLRTQFALDDSQYFSSVEVLPGDRDTENLSVPVIIQAQPVTKNRYSIGAGYGTDTRGRGTLGWENRRINRKGHRARIEIKGSSVAQTVQGSYVIPVGDPALEKIGVDLTFGRVELADTTTTGTTLRPGLTQVLGRWQRVFFVTIDNTTVTKAQGSGVRTEHLLIPGISYASIPAGFIGQPVAGQGVFAELTGSHSALGSNANYLRLRVEDERSFDLSAHWRLLLRAEIGVSVVQNFSELPASQRFFAGGDRSVRGFALNDLSPLELQKDATGQPLLDPSGNPIYLKTGGRHLLVGSVEIERDLPRHFALAAFIDGGNSINSFHDRLLYSVGVGLRWKLPAVSIGIDIAQSISKTDFVVNGVITERSLGPRLHLNIQPIFK
jgi:translocation and assembly module TamA